MNGLLAENKLLKMDTFSLILEDFLLKSNSSTYFELFLLSIGKFIVKLLLLSFLNLKIFLPEPKLATTANATCSVHFRSLFGPLEMCSVPIQNL